jgi:nicotinamidase-related amidase
MPLQSCLTRRKEARLATSLVIVDMQYDFFDESSHPSAGRLNKAICLPAVRLLVRHGRANGWKIIHVVTKHEGQHTLPPELRRRRDEVYCMENSEGAEVVHGLCEHADTVIEKSLFDAFSNPALPRELERSDKLVLSGIATDCCLLFSAHSAANVYGKEVYLPFQAVSASSLADYTFGLRSAAKSVATIVDLKHLLSMTGATPRLESLKGIPAREIESVAGPWFNEQVQRVSDLVGSRAEMPVKELLKQLEESVASGSDLA